MGYHHPAIEEADRAAMERLEANAVQPALEAIRSIRPAEVSPWVVMTLVSALSDLSNFLPEEPRECAKGYLDDCADDMKGFHRDRI